MFRTLVVRGLLARQAPQQRRRLFINGFRTFMLQSYRRSLLVTSTRANDSQIWPANNSHRYYSSSYPAHTKVVLPALSPTMEEGTLISWAKKEGDKLNEGDLLAEIETDKATMAFETPEEGYLAKILIPAGSKGVPIGKLVCIIVENEADVAAFKDFKDDSPAPAKAATAAATPTEAPAAPAAPPPPPPPAPVQQAPPPAAPKEASAQGTRVYASPMAKRLAEQRQIRLQGKGTGLFGSITSSDLDQMPAGGAAAPAAGPPSMGAPRIQTTAGNSYIDIPNSNMRATIAKRLTQSKSMIPHFYISAEVSLDTINKLRKKINKQKEKEGVRLSVNDFVVKATAMSNVAVPEANSYWMDSAIRQFANVDVSVAVATESGLITPIVFEANRKGVLEISKEVKSLAKRAREGKLQPQDYQGGTVTVSNLGMFDVKFFTAIINPPQSIILAVGTGMDKLVEDPNAPNGFRTTNTMMVTLSCDHRVVDGVVGARWLQAFRQYLEDPVTMVL
ncbi:dihydrolipoyllysine-residue acetyltransferase component of pyruvate dehydrogenase complex, mitochondrial [Atheta coriaria]|uniref:dihydrolipoyllysine-residue acetyltransferase component of pyruvate dehydrogenase complex, mitochondrial n=1 Tax=Dalotia coriaria TaxID=877792 RepID=UPI0031F43E84